MELQDALVRHLDWKVRLRTALAENCPLDVEAASNHEDCALGRWLKGEAAARYGHLPSYRACCAHHEQFHEEAGQVVRCIAEQHKAEAQARLAMSGAFSNASSVLIESLKRLREDAKQQAWADARRQKGLP